MSVEAEAEPRVRKVDRSNAEARNAIAETLARFSQWRADLATFATRVDRRFSAVDREKMLARCATIERELLAARTELLLGLADAPQKVAGHSRVVDVERALDNVSQALDALRAKLN